MRFSNLSHYQQAILILIGVVFFSPAIQAEEEHHESHHSYHKNTLGIFAGITGKDRRDQAPTFAVEYERRLTEKWGLGLMLERASGDADFTIYMASAAYHAGPWKYVLGAGVEDSDHHHGTESLIRVGLERAFEVGSFEIAPQLSVDFVDGDSVVVYGVVFAKGF